MRARASGAWSSTDPAGWAQSPRLLRHEQTVRDQPANAPEPGLVGIAAKTGLQDACEPAGGDVSRLDGDPKDQVGDLPAGAGDGDLGTAPAGHVDFAPVALVQ